MNKKVVIIGAGNSGRGFIARLFSQDGATICFVDRDERLVGKLAGEGRYSVYVGEDEKEQVICGYQAFLIDSEEALCAAAEADLIAVCVGTQNLGELKDFFVKLCERKQAKQCRVVVCENGISPKRLLGNVLGGTAGEAMAITQGVIFCTTIPKIKGELDIISEDYGQLPIDYDEELFRWESPRFPFIKNFDLLMERKIYTYNCLSACIAYLGYLKGFTDYGAAARDPGIYDFCSRVRTELDQAVSRLTGVSMEEQREFSERAIRKFTSPVIADTIEKNGRAVVRKIGPDERLMGPVRLLLRYGRDPDLLCRVTAAALNYMEQEEELVFEGVTYKDSLELFKAVNPWTISKPDLVETVGRYLREIRERKTTKERANLWNI